MDQGGGALLGAAATEKKAETRLHEYDYPNKHQLPPEAAVERKRRPQPAKNKKPPSNADSLQPYFPFPEEVWEDYSDSKQKLAAKRSSLPPTSSESGIEMASNSHFDSASLPSEVTNRDNTNSFTSSKSDDTSLGESLFLAEGILSDATESHQTLDTARATNSETTPTSTTDLPPRNIPRAMHTTSVPASNLHYYNFQPRLRPQHENTMMKVIPVPPRGLRANKDNGQQNSAVGVVDHQATRPIPSKAERHPAGEGTRRSQESNVESSRSSLQDGVGEAVPLSSLQFYSWQHSAEPDLSNYETSQRVATQIAQKMSSNNKTSSNNDDDDDDDDDGDYEYMSRYSVRSQQANGTNSFSLAALDLSNSMSKYASSQTQGQSSWNSNKRSFGSLIRTFSDTSLDCSNSSSVKSSFVRRPSLVCSSKNSSNWSLDEDSYVMMSPSSIRKAESERCISPSYVRDVQFLEKKATAESNSSSHHTSVKQLGKKKKDVAEKKISLTDAGHVVRRDWAITLEELRREHAKIAQQVAQVVRAQTGGDKLDLNEIAYLDWRNKEEAFKRDKPKGASDMFLKESEPQDSPNFLTPWKPTKYEHSHSVPSSPSSPLEFLPQLLDRDSEKSPYIPRSSAVVNRPATGSSRKDYISSVYGRSTSLPRNTIKPTNNNTSSECKSERIMALPILSNPKVIAKKPRSRESSVESEEDMEYVHEFITIGSHNRKPVPVPRKPAKKPVDSSQQASMVTMGIFRDINSSDGNVFGTFGEGRSRVPTWLKQSISEVRQ